MTADLMSRPYRPNPNLCCEACVFGRGEHAEGAGCRAARKLPVESNGER